MRAFHGAALALLDTASAARNTADDLQPVLVPLVDPPSPSTRMFSKARADVPYTDALSEVVPLRWLHIPKCGSSFQTTLEHVLAPDLPPDVTILEANHFLRDYGELVNKSRVAGTLGFQSGHVPLAPDETGRVVVMMREPRDRVVSGFHHNLHDCGWMQKEHDCADQRGVCRNASFARYAACVRGCSMRMLTGSFCGLETDGTRVAGSRAARRSAEPTVGDAIAVLSKRTGFIGLTGYWSETVCLFHARFGGPCLAAEFANLRPSAPPEPDADAGVDEWEGDPQDAALYAEGSNLFWQAIERHGVTPESCKATICPDVDPRLFDTTLVAENVTEKVSVMDAEGRRRLVDPELQIRDAACRSFASKSGNATESQWCDANCAAGYCPRYRCVCSGISGSNAGQPARSRRAHLDLRGQRFGPGRPAGAAFVRFEED